MELPWPTIRGTFLSSTGITDVDGLVDPRTGIETAEPWEIENPSPDG
jgi:hypothetical protein